jgi:protein gp37
MTRASWDTFQILTKRAERLSQMNTQIDWPDNVWAGVSVENTDYLFRIDLLRATNAKIKFLSIEPLLGPIPHLDLSNIDWVIVGGESGPKSRKMEEGWVLQVRDSCIEQNVPFFFKQWGGTNKKKNGRLLEGRTWDEMRIALFSQE